MLDEVVIGPGLNRRDDYQQRIWDFQNASRYGYVVVVAKSRIVGIAPMALELNVVELLEVLCLCCAATW